MNVLSRSNLLTAVAEAMMQVKGYLYIYNLFNNEGRKANHNNISSEPHSHHFLARATSKSSSLQYYFC